MGQHIFILKKSYERRKKDRENLKVIKKGKIRSDDKEIAYENYGDCMDATMGVSPGHVA